MRRSNYPAKGRSAPRFRYRERHGVIVLCRDQRHQRTVYNRLSRDGHACKVVSV